MDNKMLLLLLVGVGVVLYLTRKTSAAAPVPRSTGAYYQTPKAAVPSPSTAQVALAAGIGAAPQIITALGSFFSSNNDVDTSDDFDY